MSKPHAWKPAAVAVYAVRQSALRKQAIQLLSLVRPSGLWSWSPLRAAGSIKIYAVGCPRTSSPSRKSWVPLLFVQKKVNQSLRSHSSLDGWWSGCVLWSNRVPVVLGQALAAVHRLVSVWLFLFGNAGEASIKWIRHSEKTMKLCLSYIFPKVLEFDGTRLLLLKWLLENRNWKILFKMALSINIR